MIPANRHILPSIEPISPNFLLRLPFLFTAIRKPISERIEPINAQGNVIYKKTTQYNRLRVLNKLTINNNRQIGGKAYMPNAKKYIFRSVSFCIDIRILVFIAQPVRH
jgi:hypothetical protein